MMAKRISAVTHITRGDVLDDLGFSRSEATALKFKADLLDALRAEIERRNYTGTSISSLRMTRLVAFSVASSKPWPCVMASVGQASTQ
jgi:hypothetical protein